jgi:hypothetical protein
MLCNEERTGQGLPSSAAANKEAKAAQLVPQPLASGQGKHGGQPLATVRKRKRGQTGGIIVKQLGRGREGRHMALLLSS